MASRTTRALRDAARVTGVGTHAANARPAREAADRRGRRGPRIPFALLVAGLVVGALTLLLALNTASAANELRRHDLAQSDTALEVRLQELRVDVARSAAPANLATAAAALGMVPAGNPAFVVVGKDGKARVMGKPAPATEPPVSVRKPKPRHASSHTSSHASGSPKPSASSSRSSGRSPSRGESSKSKSKSPSKPTSTPTPIVTLPGGTR